MKEEEVTFPCIKRKENLIGFETETAVVAHAHFRHLQYRDGYSPL